MKNKLILLMIIVMLCSCTACQKKEQPESVKTTPTETITPTETVSPTPTPTTAVTKEPETVKPQKSVEDSGSIKDTVYTNSRLNFSVSFPDTFLLSDVDHIYKYLSSTMNTDAKELKKEFKEQGVSLLLLASDTQLNDSNQKDTFLLQSISKEVLGELSEDQMIESLVELFQQQIEKNGTKATISEPEKHTLSGQEYYILYAAYESVDAQTKEKSKHETSYIIFERENELVYANLVGTSTTLKTLTEQIANSLKFS